ALLPRPSRGARARGRAGARGPRGSRGAPRGHAAREARPAPRAPTPRARGPRPRARRPSAPTAHAADTRTRDNRSAATRSAYRRRLRSRVPMPRDAWLAAFAFAGLALLATWPAAMHLTTDLMGDGADAHSFLWNAWWIGQAVASGASPYATKLLFWPGGATLALHTLAPLVALPEAGLARVVGSVAAYDVLMIGSFAFAAWAGYLLARDVTGSRAGAFVAGAAFGFAPFHAAHALGHLNLVWYGWIALFLLAWRRRDATGSRGSLAAAAGALVAAALTDYALALLAALLAFALLVASPRVRERRAWGRLAAPGLVALLLLSPLAVAVVASYAAAPEVARASAEAPRYSLDLLSFFVPTPLPSLYAHVGHVFTPDGTATEANAFLGVTLLALAAWGVAH